MTKDKNVYVSTYEKVNDFHSFKKVLTYQPVCAYMGITHGFYRYLKGKKIEEPYKSEHLFRGSKEYKLDHAINLVGFGRTSENIEYWKCLNSWGSEWGANGTFIVPIGDNVNGIEMNIVYPVIESGILDLNNLQDPQALRALYGFNLEGVQNFVDKDGYPCSERFLDSCYALTVSVEREGCSIEELVRGAMVDKCYNVELCITSLPICLLVHLVRYSNHPRQIDEKIFMNVDVSEKLDLSEFCSEDLKLSTEMVHELVGVLTHEGPVDATTYFMYLKLWSGKCVKVDVFSEQAVSEDIGMFTQLCQNSAFGMALMLLYAPMIRN